MYPLIQNLAKFRSKSENYKMDFYPELFKLNLFINESFNILYTAQDRSPFCIFYILNEIS